MTIFAPRTARASAMAKPTPLFAPVMRTVFPCMSRLEGCFCCVFMLCSSSGSLFRRPALGLKLGIERRMREVVEVVVQRLHGDPEEDLDDLRAAVPGGKKSIHLGIVEPAPAPDD